MEVFIFPDIRTCMVEINLIAGGSDSKVALALLAMQEVEFQESDANLRRLIAHQAPGG